jgi:hypothetical protein
VLQAALTACLLEAPEQPAVRLAEVLRGERVPSG